jgi:cyanophycinase
MNGTRVVWILLALLSLTAIGFSHWLTRVPDSDTARDDFVNQFKGGTLVIAGGGTLPPEIRQRFLDLAGGPRQARLLVIPAFDAGDDQQAALLSTWQKLGATSVQILHTTSRDEANTAAFAGRLDQANAVWLSGGVQSWLSEHYAGTLVEEKLKGVVSRGGVVGGSSAGAAAMTRVMIEQGMEDAKAGVGLDLFHGAVIDQHFLRRSRMNRLLGLMESHPDLMAFGIDEGTALVVQVPRRHVGVIGASYVFAYIPQADDGEPRYEVLKNRDHIDLAGLKGGRVRVSSPIDFDSLVAE